MLKVDQGLYWLEL